MFGIETVKALLTAPVTPEIEEEAFYMPLDLKELKGQHVVYRYAETSYLTTYGVIVDYRKHDGGKVTVKVAPYEATKTPRWLDTFFVLRYRWAVQS